MADLVIIDDNPIENLKVLYGTGLERLNDATGNFELILGVKFPIKGSIIYDLKSD